MIGNCLLWTLSVKYLYGVSVIYNSYTHTVDGNVDPTLKAIAYMVGVTYPHQCEEVILLC